MAPPRKSRSVNKRYPYNDEASPNKDEYVTKRSSRQKKKITGMVGLRWSMEELTRFYDSYRKNGKDWKKVASAVRNRSPEMVEALYSMNKAYLSLPHGTASAAGLIAMMTDHYSNLAGSDSDQESYDGVGSSRKMQNRARGKIPATASKALDEQYVSNSPTAESNIGCMSLLKRKRSGTRPRPVGKRTPRFPVSFLYENTKVVNYSSPNKRMKFEDYADDEEVALALALTEASQRGGSPQFSGTPSKVAESVMSSPFRHNLRKHSGMETATKMSPNEMDEGLEGSTEGDTGELLRSIGDGTISKKENTETENIETDIHKENHLDDVKEECSATEEGHTLCVAGTKFDVDVNDSMVISPTQNQRKKSKKALFRKDEGPIFHALQTLADLSLLMPSENEEESTLPLKDENQDHAGESSPLEAPTSNRPRQKCRSSSVRKKSSEVATRKTSKPRKRAGFDDDSVLDDKQDSRNAITKTTRKKQKMQASKMQKKDADTDIHDTRTPGVEAADPGKKMAKNKMSPQKGSQNLMKISENSSNAYLRKEVSDSAQSVAQNLANNHDAAPTKARSRHKKITNKPEVLIDLKLSDKTSSDFSSLSETALNLKESLSHCLSNPLLRRFCTFEWFYSAIDYPWFAKKEFEEYLNHVGLGHVPRLTRTEWSFIKSSLGKPRRFSQQFLKQEKEKLNQYRDSVRKHYTELREGTREGLPTDLARPLSVGQRVIAIHPKTREIHDGSVLTVDHSKFHVQFNRNDLGVEFVMDIDCMPLNPVENIPAMLGRRADFVDRYFENLNEQNTNGHAKEYIKTSPCDNMDIIDATSHSLPFPNPASVLKETKVQAKEADAQAIAELTRALDKKEAIVAELRLMNDDVLESQRDSGSSLKDEESFKKQYAAVLMQLNEANEEVSSSLLRLRQRNTYQEKRQPASPSSDHFGTWDSFDRSVDEAGSNVNDIMDSSRTKAQTMINAAIQAMSSLKNRNDDSIEKIEEAIDYVNEWLPSDDNCASNEKSANQQEIVTQYPYDLIMKCIATMVMIQKCTERQFPPSDVARILDYAVTSLQPRSSQNLPVYTDIQKCFGIIKNQILALIPT